MAALWAWGSKGHDCCVYSTLIVGVVEMGNHLRRMCALLLTVSVVFAGVRYAHAFDLAQIKQGQAGHGVHLLDTGDQAAAGKMDCHEPGDEQKSDSPSHHGNNGGCCYSASPPSMTVRDGSDIAAHDFDIDSYGPHVDRGVVAHIPEGQFRPPRDWT